MPSYENDKASGAIKVRKTKDEELLLTIYKLVKDQGKQIKFLTDRVEELENIVGSVRVDL